MNKNNHEEFPQILRNFVKNNPDKKCHNLYLCELVDMDGNIVDTKVGVNLMTNFGIEKYFGRDNSQNYKIWLGSDSADPSPNTNYLNKYLENFGEGKGLTFYGTDLAKEFDSVKGIFYGIQKISQMYWDYTQGSGEVWELGIGIAFNQLWTHANIFDEHGQKTCITKKSGERLYVTVYWMGGVNVSELNQMYVDGKYFLVDPSLGIPSFSWSNKSVYWGLLSRTPIKNPNNSGWAYSTDAMKPFSWIIIPDVARYAGSYAQFEFGMRDTETDDHDRFWEDDCYYMTGNFISLMNSWRPDNTTSIFETKYLSLAFYDLMPDPEILESYWAYTNRTLSNIIQDSYTSTYTGDEMSNPEFFRLDKLFGVADGNRQSPTGSGHAYDWEYPSGMLPCTNFSISELNMYNYISKDWDINVPYKNEPDKIYDESWTRVYLKLLMNYGGSDKNVYVFVNRYPHDSSGKPVPRITAFNNSGIVIAGTDAYWDTSTYTEIPNLNSVPSELQQKRYYVITNGNAIKLEPVMSRSDEHCHEINPALVPYEMTHETTGVIPRIRDYVSYDSWGNIPSEVAGLEGVQTIGTKPLVSNTKGYFVLAYLIAFVDSNNNWTYRNLLLEDKYPCSKSLRWITRNGDKIVMFGSRTMTDLSNDTGTIVTKSYRYGANHFGVWTITDASTAPVYTEHDLTWTTPSLDSSSGYHLYSWSDYGYLVAAKHRTETEFIWVDINATGGPAQHIVQNAKHARVIENTTYVIYQDMNLSVGSQYVFKIFDMSTNTEIKTLTIDDGTSYTIKGIYGYNQYVYVRVISSGNIVYTYFFDTTANTSERSDWNLRFLDSDVIYLEYSTNIVDDMCIVSYGINMRSYILKGYEKRDLFDENNTSIDSAAYNIWPCVNKINNDKQYILTMSGTSSTKANVILDLGLMLDNDFRYTEHHPKKYYAYDLEYSDLRNTSGPIFPFNNGIIRMCSGKVNGYNTYCGRVFWFPPSMCMPMHIKGTTKTLNSYNQPLRWKILRTISWRLSSDIDDLT